MVITIVGNLSCAQFTIRVHIIISLGVKFSTINCHPPSRLGQIPLVGIPINTIGMDPITSIMLSIGGWVTYFPSSHLSLAKKLPSSGVAKVCHCNIRGWSRWVDKGARILIVAPTDQASTRGIVGAHRKKVLHQHNL